MPTSCASMAFRFLLVQRLARPRRPRYASKISDGVDAAPSCPAGCSREEARDEVGAIGRQLEERLVHQVQLQVAAADVDDERDRRLEGRDVGEVLFGADADVGAAPRRRSCSRSGMTNCSRDSFDRRLSDRKRAARLGQVGDERPEFLIGEARRAGGSAAVAGAGGDIRARTRPARRVPPGARHVGVSTSRVVYSPSHVQRTTNPVDLSVSCRLMSSWRRRWRWRRLRCPALTRRAAAPRRRRKTLDIYFIDVEGGQSTLVVTPAGQSLLIDAGYAGFDNRDPDRIMAAARDARRQTGSTIC